MESLALIVSIILLAILLLGGLSFITVIRTPRSHVGRVLAFVIGVAAVLSGAWLALLRVGIGARFFGVLVFCCGAISLLRIIRARRTDSGI